MIRAVAHDFLPPDPYADPARAPRPEPPRDPGSSEPPIAALALGSAGLALLVLTTGSLFFLALPLSVAALVLGVRARRATPPPPRADVAVIIGAVGIVLGVIATVVWIIVLASGGDLSSGLGSGVVQPRAALR
jgi:hypothetical protein